MVVQADRNKARTYPAAFSRSIAVLTISALGLLDVPNGWLLAVTIAAIAVLAGLFIRMRRNEKRALATAALATAR